MRHASPNPLCKNNNDTSKVYKVSKMTNNSAISEKKTDISNNEGHIDVNKLKIEELENKIFN